MLLLCFLWGGRWVDNDLSRLLCGRWHLRQLFPSPWLEGTSVQKKPVVRERVSKRTAVPMDSLVAERLSSPLRPQGRVRTRHYVTGLMSLPCGWPPATVVVASCGGLLRLRTACIACGERRWPLKVTSIRSFETGCEKGGYTSWKKRLESTCNACIAWHQQEVHWLTNFAAALWPEAAMRQGYASAQIKGLVPTGIACNAWRRKTMHWHKWNLNATTSTGVSDGGRRPKHRQTAPSRWHVNKAVNWPRHAVLDMCTVPASTLAKGASSDKCDPVTGHTWEECEWLCAEPSLVQVLSPGFPLCGDQGPA